MRLPLTPHGAREISLAGVSALAAGAALWAVWPPLSALAGLGFVYVLAFFRDPARVPAELPLPDRGPESYHLYPNHPNPFNPSTSIRYDLPEASVVRLAVYNALGQQVRMLVSQEQAAGSYDVVWDGRDGSGRVVSSGVYLMQFRAGTYARTHKMLLLK